MEGKSFGFLFSFFSILLPLLVISEIDVNPDLQTQVSCSSSPEDSCDPETSDSSCNSAGKCQCLLSFTPSTSGLGCELLKCNSSAMCSQWYQTENVLCISNVCICHYDFQLDAQTQKCVLENPTTRRLGAHCVADHQCSGFAKCSVSGQCQCEIGTRPDSTHTCELMECFSDEFCHTNVTANTVCNLEYNLCECREPNFEHDDEEFTCVDTQPPALKLGAKCSGSIRCGDGAQCTTGSEPICKCQVGYEATTDIRCEPVRCAKDLHCHRNVSPLTSCYNGQEKSRSSCRCKEGYYENPESLTCSPNSASLFLEAIAKDWTPRHS